MNNFLQFYGANKISPVDQNISDIEIHFKRRLDLYREIGLPTVVFESKEVLEVAPGSGFNSIVIANLPIKLYDLVEPNPTGFEKMVDLFTKTKSNKTEIRFHNTTLENFKAKLYDIVICEGLLPGLNDHEIFLKKLTTHVKVGGILVLTTVDSVSVFFETMRRYLAILLIKNNNLIEFNSKVTFLTKTFSNHISSLKGATRSTEDWVIDNLLNPATISIANQNEFSFSKSINLLSDKFIFYGSSPNFISNYKWYKSIQDDLTYNKGIIIDYESKIHNLLNMNELGLVSIENNKTLINLTKIFAKIVEEKYSNIENDLLFTNNAIISDLSVLQNINLIIKKNKLNNSEFVMDEFLNLFKNGNLPSSEDINSMKYFNKAFGRGQQYISFIKTS